MVPGKYNITCPQGSTFVKQIIYTIDDVPVNLAGFTARMQVRESYSSENFTIELTTENGGITLGGALGTIDVFISDLTTQTLKPREYVYDLELVSSGSQVSRLIEGKFLVTPEVTR